MIEGGRDRESIGGWETEGIMGVLIARSMLSGAQGTLAPIPVLCFTCCSHSLIWPMAFVSLCLPFIFFFLTPLSSSLSLFGVSALPSFIFHTYTHPLRPQSAFLLRRHMVLWMILLGRWYEVFQGLVWWNSLRLLRHSTPVHSPPRV